MKGAISCHHTRLCRTVGHTVVGMTKSANELGLKSDVASPTTPLPSFRLSRPLFMSSESRTDPGRFPSITILTGPSASQPTSFTATSASLSRATMQVTTYNAVERSTTQPGYRQLVTLIWWCNQAAHDQGTHSAWTLMQVLHSITDALIHSGGLTLSIARVGCVSQATPAVLTVCLECLLVSHLPIYLSGCGSVPHITTG